MRILLDMDGPLADFDAASWAVIEANGWELDIAGRSEQRHHYVTEHMKRRDRRALRKIIETPGWFENLPVVAGAVEGVDWLLGAGHDVWVCTKPLEANPTCRDGKGAWLREHIPELEDRLIIAPDKSLVTGDILLDDAPAPGQIARASWRPVVFSAPYNGVGSKWEHEAHWEWDMPFDDLIGHAR